MSYIARWFTGFTFAVVTIKESMNECPANKTCTAFTIHETVGVNCSHRCLDRIPGEYPFINPHISVLDISYNPDIKLHDQDLNNYEKLHQLFMKGLYNAAHFSKKFFDPLRSLELLDLTDMPLRDDTGAIGLILPESLVTCIVNNCSITSFDISHLGSLVELEIENNDLNDIPLISKEAPLDLLDLRMNPLNNLKYTDLAPFCLLSTIYMENSRYSKLNSSSKYSQCCQIEKWLKQLNINGTTSLNCTSTANQKCEFANETEYDFAQNQRYICLLKSGLVAPPYGFLFYFANGLGILVLFCAISYLIYKYYNKVDRIPASRTRRRNIDSSYVEPETIDEEE